jgi:nitrous oxidase accessory protein NosD
MKRKALALTLTWGILTSLVAMPHCVNFTSAQNFEAITIKADGSIDPSTAPITQDGNIYTLTGDVSGSITVEKFNIVLDGAGYTLQGNGTERGIQIFNPPNATVRSSYDIMVKNFNVKGFEEGIDVFGYWGNIISGVIISRNNVTENDAGIRFSSYDRYSNNIIVGNRIVENNRGLVMEMGHMGNDSGNIMYANQVENNQAGMWFLWLGDYYSWKPNPFEMNNNIFCNNFVNNHQNVVNAHIIYDPDCANIWDSGEEGNYWSDYNGSDTNGDGVGDTPYVIDTNNQDRYPLIMPVDITDINSPTPSPSPAISPTPNATDTPIPSPTASPETPEFSLWILLLLLVTVVTGVILLVFFNKRKH